MAGSLTAVAWLWGKGLNSTEQHPLRLIPVLSLLGALLFTGGWGWVTLHRQELLILVFLGVPHLLMWWAGIPHLLARWDAALAGFLLWYTGTNVRVLEDSIALEGGAIRVTAECAGSDIVTYLLGIALIALLLFPLRQPRYGLVLGLAAGIAFLVNVLRVALLAVLNTLPDKQAFQYWHTSEGSQVFGVIALGLFAGWYWWMGRNDDSAISPRSRRPLPGGV